ncbi:MAG: carboxypeptidase-like regulatory domain-containing protein [Thermoanaerobaculia bacterium]
MIPALLLLAAAVKPASVGIVAGRAPAGSVVFLSVPVEEVPPPASGAALKITVQKGRVVPAISAAQLGSSLQITLLDSEFADLSVYFGLSELAFRHKFVLPGDVSRTRLSRPGLMTIENENSPTERAFIYVASTACFAIAGSDGRYRLQSVPAGKRRITAWDEAKGTEDKDVVVPAGGEVGLDFGK